jgi:hypothetical protein
MKDEGESFISRLPAVALAAFRDVWIIWLTLAVLTTLPYVVAALRAPAGFAFSGVLTAYDDTFTYFAWMRLGADGHLLMCDPFTSEPQRCEFFLPLWSVLGLVSRVTHIPIPLTFHVTRLLAALGLLLAARGVARSGLRSRNRRRFSLWLYVLSGGFGWLVYALNNRGDVYGGARTSGSTDLNLPEAIAFRSIFSQVHFVVGATLVCGAIKLFFNAIVEKRTNRALMAGMLVSLLAVVHPYMVVVVCGIAAVALISMPWVNDTGQTARVTYYSLARVAVAFCAGTIPGVAYAGYLNRSNEVLREWLRVTDTYSPPPWEYALGFGIVGVLAVMGFLLMWRGRRPYGRLLLIWAAVQAGLLYAPMSIQRRFVEGLQLPLAIAATVAMFWIAGRLVGGPGAVRKRKVILVCTMLFASLTNVAFLIGQVVARGAGTGSTDPRRYLPVDLISASDWLRANSEPEAVVFSSYLTGNVVPSVTGLRVFLGHYAQTLRSDEKGAQVTAFYGNEMRDEMAWKLFVEHRVRFVIYGSFEREISSAFVPPAWLRLVHREGDVLVFEVTERGQSASQ